MLSFGWNVFGHTWQWKTGFSFDSLLWIRVCLIKLPFCFASKLHWIFGYLLITSYSGEKINGFPFYASSKPLLMNNLSHSVCRYDGPFFETSRKNRISYHHCIILANSQPIWEKIRMTWFSRISLNNLSHFIRHDLP